MKKKYKEIEKVVQYQFKDYNLLKKSLIHKSYDNIFNNEKL